MTPCLGDDTVTAYVEGHLTEGGRRAAQAHLDTCPACRALTSDVARASAQERGPSEGAAAVAEAAVDEAGVGSLFAGSSYRIERRLGRGGAGEVYLARDERLSRPVALKLLRDLDASAAARLLSEARITARFNHPHIVTVYEVGEHGGVPYLALEYLEGPTLRQRIDAAAGPLPLREVLTVARAVAAALVEAHGRGVLHRDLTPRNVMLPPDGRPRVLDFGLSDTGAGLLAGTPGYMAPEQWQGAALTPAADLFALGVILYELCSGARPYAGAASAAELCRLTTAPAPIPAVRSAPGLSAEAARAPWLLDLIDRCLCKDPALRPDAHAALVALQAGGARRRLRGPLALAGLSIAVAAWRLAPAPPPLAAAPAFVAVASPTRAMLTAVWGSGPTQVWAVGRGGTVLRYDGARWSAQEVPTRADLHGVWGQGDAVWIVGERGTVLWGGRGGFRALDSGVGERLDAVTGGGGAVWAVGQGGVVLRGDGARFQRQVSGTTLHLRGAYARSAEDVWIVGGAEDRGVVLRYSRAGLHRSEVGVRLRGVFAAAPGRESRSGSAVIDQVFAVGGTPQGDHQAVVLALSERGEPRRIEPELGAEGNSRWLQAVWGGADGVWIVGDGGTVLLRERGGRWRRAGGPSQAHLRGVWSSAGGPVWAVGTDGALWRSPP